MKTRKNLRVFITVQIDLLGKAGMGAINRPLRTRAALWPPDLSWRGPVDRAHPGHIVIRTTGFDLTL